MWPLTVTIANLPPWLRSKLGASAPLGLTPMNNFHNLQAFFEPMLDELVVLWEDGCLLGPAGGAVRFSDAYWAVARVVHKCYNCCIYGAACGSTWHSNNVQSLCVLPTLCVGCCLNTRHQRLLTATHNQALVL